jgi:hypothetical protein
MMTKNLFLLGLLAPVSLLAQTRTSVADGNATNPFTWDCTCIPLPGNNIVINHDVILDSDFAYTSGSVTINASGSLTGTTTDRIFGLSGGTFTNNGTFNIYNLFHAGGTFTNNGTITVTNGFAIGGTANTQNNNTLTINDSLLVDISATLTNPASTYAKYSAIAGTLNNTGAFSGTDLWSSGTLNNNGIYIDIVNLYTSGLVNNGCMLDISNDFWNSENVVNSHQVVIGNDMWNGDTISGTATFTNNGTISVGHDLNNSETLNGSGSYCIAGTSSNVGDVNGTLFICDQTGNDFDNNFGTIAGTVTYCSTGSCILGTTEQDNGISRVYPNPVSNRLNIEMSTSGLYTITLFNGMGQQVSQQNFTGNRVSIDLGNMAAGMYVYSIQGAGIKALGKVVKE